MARSIGDAFLGGMTLAQQANQSRFENQYRNRVLDLDNRTLAERTRQFDLAYKSDQDAQKLARDQFGLDERKQIEDERAAKATEKNFAARTDVLQQSADTQDDIQALNEQKYGDEVRQDYATEQARTYLSRGWLTDDGTGLNDDFFTRGEDGRLVNRNQIIDLLDLNSEALISQSGEGQFRDMEVAGFDYDKETKTTRVLLRGKGTDEDPVPLTANATDSETDPVVELTESELRDFTRRQWDIEIIPKIDSDKVDLTQVQAAKLAQAAVIAQREKDVKGAVTSLTATQSNAGLIRDVERRLADTKDDPEARAELLRQIGVDPAQFETASDPTDPTKQYLGPESPVEDPLSTQPAVFSAGSVAGGPTPFFKNESGQQTEFSNLVSELQQNFEESEKLRTQPSSPTERQITGEERQSRQAQLEARRTSEPKSSSRGVRRSA